MSSFIGSSHAQRAEDYLRTVDPATSILPPEWEPRYSCLAERGLGLGCIANENEQHCNPTGLPACPSPPKTFKGLASPRSLSGTLPSDLGARFPNLRMLNLGAQPHLSGHLAPIAEAQLANLTYVRLHWSKVSGTIPPGLGSQPDLAGLDFVGNRFISGTLPPELGRLTKMTDLHLYVALNLHGRVDTIMREVFSNMTRLARLNLGAVPGLSGTIPAQELGRLTNLKELWLFHTTISGTMPDTLRRLTKLAVFNTQGPLSGTLPAGLATNLTNLTDLYPVGLSVDCYNDPSGFSQFCLMEHRVEFWMILVAVFALCLLIGRRVALCMTRGALEAKEQPTTVRVPELAFKKIFPRSTRFDFAKLTLRRHLGNGAFGDVHEALYIAQEGGAANHRRQQQTSFAGAKVAVKTMKREFVTALQHRDVILECERHLFVSHELDTNDGQRYPFILQCLGWTTPPRSRDFCMVLEYAEGGSLGDYLRKGYEANKPATAAHLLAWALEIGSAILHVHSLGILHRDISARNVVLVRGPDPTSSSGQGGGDGTRLVAKLADFGLARRGTRGRSRHRGRIISMSDGGIDRGNGARRFSRKPLVYGSLLHLHRRRASSASNAHSTRELRHQQPLSASSAGLSSSIQADLAIPVAWAAPEVLTAQTRREDELPAPRENTAVDEELVSNITADLAFETSESSESWAFAVLLWEMQTQGAQPYADVDDIPAFVLGGGRLDLPSLAGGSLETAHALPEFNAIMASVFSPPEPTPRPSIAEITQRLQNARAVHFLDWDLDELQAWLDRLGIPPDSDLYEAYEITCPADIYENLKSNQRGADGAVKARYWDSAEEISEDSGLGDPQAVRELYRELDGFERLGEYVRSMAGADQRDTKASRARPSASSPVEARWTSALPSIELTRLSTTPKNHVDESMEEGIRGRAGSEARDQIVHTAASSVGETKAGEEHGKGDLEPDNCGGRRRDEIDGGSSLAERRTRHKEAVHEAENDAVARELPRRTWFRLCDCMAWRRSAVTKKLGGGNQSTANAAQPVALRGRGRRTRTGITLVVGGVVAFIFVAGSAVASEATRTHFLGVTFEQTQRIIWLIMMLLLPAIFLGLAMEKLSARSLRRSLRMPRDCRNHTVDTSLVALAVILVYLFCVILGPVYQEYFGADAVVSAWGLSAVKYYLSITDPQTTATLVLAVALVLLSILTPILTIRQALYYYKEFSIVTLTLSKSKFKVDLPASSRFDATQVTTGPELGSGAFGTVFRGDLRTDVGSGSLTTPVAVKTVKSALVTESQQRDVMIECATHMKLNHPNVVQCFGWVIPPANARRRGLKRDVGSFRRLAQHRRRAAGHSGDVPGNKTATAGRLNHEIGQGDSLWVLVELMDGGGLDAYLAKHREDDPAAATSGDNEESKTPALPAGLAGTRTTLPESWRVLWAAQIASAIAYIHSQGILHRDIAARNVVLSLDPEDTGGSGVPIAKVTDFGLSRCTGQRQRGGAAVAGTYYATVDANSGKLRTAIPFPWTAPECLEMSETKRQIQSQSSAAVAASGDSSSLRISKKNTLRVRTMRSLRTRTRVRPTVRSTPGNDVWAFGVLLWEIETGGAAPFKGLKESVMKHIRQGGRLIPPASASPILERAMQRAWEPAESRPSMKEFLDTLLGPSYKKRERIACASKWDPAEAAAWLDRHSVPRDHELRRVATTRGGAGLMRKVLGERGKLAPDADHQPQVGGDIRKHGSSAVQPDFHVRVEVKNPLAAETAEEAPDESKGPDVRGGAAGSTLAATNHGTLELAPQRIRQEMLGLRALEEWTEANHKQASLRIRSLENDLAIAGFG